MSRADDEAAKRGLERMGTADSRRVFDLLEDLRKSWERILNGYHGRAGRDLVTTLATPLRGITDALVRLRTGPTQRPTTMATAHVAPSAAPRTQRAVAEMARATVRAMGPGGSKPVEQRILNALAELEQLGASVPVRELVAFLAGYTHVQSTGFVKALGALRTRGLIDYPSPGNVTLTDDGRRRAQPPARPSSPEEVQERIIRMLGGAAGRILAPLIAAYPSTLTRSDVATKAGYGHVQSTGFVKALGRLHTLGFVDYQPNGILVANPVLFLEGR